MGSMMRPKSEIVRRIQTEGESFSLSRFFAHNIETSHSDMAEMWREAIALSSRIGKILAYPAANQIQTWVSSRRLLCGIPELAGG